ncbi:uncharacterized protein FFMR_13286 [Fusarium fujikuroi]
MQGPS